MKKQTFRKTALSLAIAFSVGGLATQAIAQDSAVTKNGLVTETTSRVNGSLVEVGTPQNSVNLKGFAKGLPLIAVLKQITPNDWVVKKAKGRTLDLQKPVSWTGGKSWVETLREVSENSGIEALVNWDKKEVVLAQNEIKSTTNLIEKSDTQVNVVTKNTPTVGVFELASEVVTEGNSGQKEMIENKEIKTVVVQVETPITPIPVVQVVAPIVEKSWSFEGKDNLKEVVESWGKKAGYKIVYTGENYPLDKEDARILTGEFEDEDGPIKQLSEDYGPDSRVKKPLSFIFYQNGRLVVEDLRYEQSGYPQYIQK